MNIITKEEIQQRVLKDGKPLELDLFTWDENTRTFSTKEDHLVLDFSDLDNCTFNAKDNCSFKVGEDCIFNTGHSCTFNTSRSNNCNANRGQWNNK